MLQPGQTAPDFSLPDADMQLFEFASLRGRQHAVIFFYPKDGTPLCIKEAVEFSDHETEFNDLDCAVFGVSRDDCQRHADFSEEHGLSIRLLSDENGAVGRLFGIAQMREKDGQRKLCVIRSTFVIDKDGIVRNALYDVTPKGHVAEVLKLVKAL